MKKTFLLLVAIATFGFANAQIEAKINPLGAVFGRPDISAEYIVSDVFGVEAGVSFAFGKAPGVSVDGVGEANQSGLGFKIEGKYYFSPDDACDGWYGGLYLRQESRKITYSGVDSSTLALDYKSNIFAGGVEFGKKWVFDSGFLIEAALGVGRPFTETREFIDSDSEYSSEIKLGVDLTGKFAIGYRFN